MKKLWLALVEHQVVPGTVPVLLYAEDEPSDFEVVHAPQFAGQETPQLVVVGMFDLSFSLRDPYNLAAFITAAEDIPKEDK